MPRSKNFRQCGISTIAGSLQAARKRIAFSEAKKSYRLDPGKAGVYFGRELHSTATSPNTRYLRITGTDLENIERLRINAETGRIERIRAAQTNSAVAG